MSQMHLMAKLGELRGETLRTPSGRKSFIVSRLENGRVTVTTSNESEVHVSVTGIQAVLDYLARHGHGREHPCPVKSSNPIADAGPLCLAAREGKSQRKITYVLPLLERLGLVGFDRSARATAVFLVNRA
ncbi:hypothetical protein [Herbaspirillum sp. SJZ107]|uniref:hypothetical protein n=1 Tax=Herbaspirillum sp. SJZ107 TaxID=2572881 RepID=UPI001152C0C2|nr:hypothetical protein [Herbaspirillum sp. SJZ107]TQK03453.1 hypothetical protein FBX97_5021 [Herbaspirillum sp. SJZ107]